MIMQDGHGIRYYKFEAKIQREGRERLNKQQALMYTFITMQN